MPFVPFPLLALCPLDYFNPPYSIRTTVTMGVGAILEPLVVIVLLFGGTWINRSKQSISRRCRWQGSSPYQSRPCSPDVSDSDEDGTLNPRSWSPSLLHIPDDRWRKRQIRIFSSRFQVTTPNTEVFRDRLLSRVLRKFPFLVECWYWALVYWVWLVVHLYHQFVELTSICVWIRLINSLEHSRHLLCKTKPLTWRGNMRYS